MNHATHTIGNAASVANRFGTENGFVRPEKLLDVLCYNNTGGTLFMQVFDINDGLIPFGSTFDSVGFLLITGFVVGHTYKVIFGPNDTQLNNFSGTIVGRAPGEFTFVATGGTSCTLTGVSANALATAYIVDVTAPISTPAPVAGAVPTFSFPVQTGLGGTLGRCVDMTGIFCAWSSTALTYTDAGASGSIEIIIKG